MSPTLQWLSPPWGCLGMSLTTIELIRDLWEEGGGGLRRGWREEHGGTRGAMSPRGEGTREVIGMVTGTIHR